MTTNVLKLLSDIKPKGGDSLVLLVEDEQSQVSAYVSCLLRSGFSRAQIKVFPDYLELESYVMDMSQPLRDGDYLILDCMTECGGLFASLRQALFWVGSHAQLFRASVVIASNRPTVDAEMQELQKKGYSRVFIVNKNDLQKERQI